MSVEFREFPKIPRLNRDVIITEKIDGTNAAVVVTDGGVYAQSRKRIITPGDDNFGFAGWVAQNAEALASVLGPGWHYGEWYGLGIQRGYGLTERRFALFNPDRYAEAPSQLERVDVVPVLARHTFTDNIVKYALHQLREDGSQLVPGFKPAEGIVVYHTAGRHTYKVLLENDDIPKGLAA